MELRTAVKCLWNRDLRLLALAALGAASAGCGVPVEGLSDEAVPAVAGETLEVVAGPLRARHVLAGQLVAADSLAFAAPNVNIHPLQIRWLVEDGRRVAAGDRIVEFDNTSLVTQLETLETQVEERETELEVAAALAAAQIAEARFAVLSAQVQRRKAEIEASIPEDLTSAMDYANLQLELDKAVLEESEAERALEAARETATADVDIKRLAYDRAVREQRLARDRIAQLELVAPRPGVVILQENRQEDRVFQMGDSSHVGAVIARLPDLESLRVEADLYDVDDGLVVVGMKAIVTLDAFPREQLVGRVSRVEKLARQASRRSRRRVFLVGVDLPGLDRERSLPGMSARVILERARW